VTYEAGYYWFESTYFKDPPQVVRLEVQSEGGKTQYIVRACGQPFGWILGDDDKLTGPLYYPSGQCVDVPDMKGWAKQQVERMLQDPTCAVWIARPANDASPGISLLIDVNGGGELPR
jgi:hypothetical protein